MIKKECIMMDVGEFGKGERACVDYIIKNGIEVKDAEGDKDKIIEEDFQKRTNRGGILKTCEYCKNQYNCSGYINNDISDVCSFMPVGDIEDWEIKMQKKAEKCKDYEEE